MLNLKKLYNRPRGTCMRHLFALLFFYPLSLLSLNFDHLTVDDGLSSNHVYTIHQDSLGFMWFGTTRGLNRWDGTEFRIFRHDPADTNSLSADEVKSIYEDSTHNLWLGTVHGLNKFNLETEYFTRYLFDDDSTGSSYIFYILPQDSNTLWLGTTSGLVKFSICSETYERYKYVDENSIRTMNRNYIYSLGWLEDGHIIIGCMDDFITFDPASRTFGELSSYFQEQNIGGGFCNYRDSGGLLWLGTSNGQVFQWHEKNDSLFLFSEQNPLKKPVLSILEDHAERLWIATLGGGVFIFDKSINGWTQYLPSVFDNYALTTTMCAKLFRDRQGNIWIGSYDGGANILPGRKKTIHVLRRTTDDDNSIGDGEVHGFCEDRDGNLWVTSMGGGISRISPNFKTIRNFLNDKTQKLNYAWTHTIEEDRYGHLWFGGRVSVYYDWKTKISRYIDAPNLEKVYYLNGTITEICQDSSGNMWFGSAFNGLKCLTVQKEFIEYRHDPQDSTSIAANHISDLCCDHTGTLWVGTPKGLCRFDSELQQFEHYNLISSTGETISVGSILEDTKGLLWFGCSEGLCSFDPSKNHFQVWTPYLNLGFESVLALVQDDNDYLWLRTTGGLIRFFPGTKEVKHFTHADGFVGLNTSIWARHAFYRGHSGHIYYGGTRILGKFHPDSLNSNSHTPIVLTILDVNYSEVVPGAKSLLATSLPYTKKLVLPYSATSFSIQFSEPGFSTLPTQNYQYKLDGFHDEWIPATEHKATFTNLPPGAYTFQVRQTPKDKDEIPAVTSLAIFVRPPWWQTPWSIILYIILAGGLLFAVYRFQLHRARLKQEIFLEREHSQKLQELDSLKSSFFANISHEFRTPLTLILGPLEQYYHKMTSPNDVTQFEIMIRNGRRLLQLINQLLDFSKLESGRMTLQASEADVVSFVKRIVSSFMSFAERKKIALDFQSSDTVLLCYLDKDIMEKAITNILSNAFKFTAEYGHISVVVRKKVSEKPDEYVIISISDNGIGIPEDKLDAIFNRFYQVDGSRSRKGEGTGIGLALTKELIERHHGNIYVKSKLKYGSTFEIALPLGRDHLRDEEIVNEPISEFIYKPEDIEIEPPSPEKQKTSAHKPLVLIVEDNPDVRFYICSFLANEYRIREARDGIEGFAFATTKMPDVIISDVMMPEMDGFVLCEKLKKDERTSHIPIILLTARASDESKLSGLETGADDYIIKPFNTNEVRARVKNLIAQRQILREKFSHKITVSPSDVAVTSVDEQFLRRIIAVIEEHMASADFSTEFLAKKIGLSRMQLHRKLKALTDLSTSRFIQTIRLKRAAQLLNNNAAPVTQIAYEVGFENPTYFAECFKKHFGVAPSKYTSHKV